MKEYRVVWEIDITADDPIEAAKYALNIQRDPCSWATVFDVYDENGCHKVDVMDPTWLEEVE